MSKTRRSEKSCTQGQYEHRQNIKGKQYVYCGHSFLRSAVIIVTGQQALHNASVQSVSGKQSLCFADKRLHREKYISYMNLL